MGSEDEQAGTLPGFDRFIHDATRFAICAALLNCENADFVFLRKTLGLTSGNLAFHLSRLEEVGVLTVTRQLVGRTTRTEISLTAAGRERVARHWDALERLRNLAADERSSAGRGARARRGGQA